MEEEVSATEVELIHFFPTADGRETQLSIAPCFIMDCTYGKAFAGWGTERGVSDVNRNLFEGSKSRLKSG